VGPRAILDGWKTSSSQGFDLGSELPGPLSTQRLQNKRETKSVTLKMAEVHSSEKS